MNFYFDESGDFSIPVARTQNAVGVSMAVVIPDETQAQTLGDFDAFVHGLPRAAFQDSEPKRNLLDTTARRQFVEFLSACDGILVCPIMLDLTALTGRADVDVQGAVVAKLEAYATKCKHPKMQEQVALLARQFRRLSLEQSLRLATWARCIMRSLHDSIITHSAERFHASWNHLRFEIDPVQRSPGNREEQVFNTMVLAWVCAWSEAYPFTTIEHIHDSSHPFVRNFDTPAGINFGKIIQGNLHYPLSNDSKGIQIADMAASVVSKATRGVADAVDIQNYGLMMTKAIGEPLYASGLFSFVEPDIQDWRRRFMAFSNRSPPQGKRSHVPIPDASRDDPAT
jgi:hypothetical protein